MREKHIVLRSPRRATRDIFLGTDAAPSATGAAEGPAAGLQVEVEEIERREIPALTNEGGVLAVAPAMPMRLVAPVDRENTAQPATASVAWGVQAVWADTSPFTGQGIVVAVLDAGINPTHPAFAGVNLSSGGTSPPKGMTTRMVTGRTARAPFSAGPSRTRESASPPG